MYILFKKISIFFYTPYNYTLYNYIILHSPFKILISNFFHNSYTLTLILCNNSKITLFSYYWLYSVWCFQFSNYKTCEIFKSCYLSIYKKKKLSLSNLMQDNMYGRRYFCTEMYVKKQIRDDSDGKRLW